MKFLTIESVFSLELINLELYYQPCIFELLV